MDVIVQQWTSPVNSTTIALKTPPVSVVTASVTRAIKSTESTALVSAERGKIKVRDHF